MRIRLASFALIVPFVLVALLTLPAPAHAQLASVEVGKMLLVYVEGSESFLVPHAGRTFLNSLASQKKLFGYEPETDISVLLLDLQDSGNASATSVPRNALTVHIAPLSYAFETIPSNERMNAIMNHELVHIVTHGPGGGTRPVLPAAVRRQGRCRLPSSPNRCSIST